MTHLLRHIRTVGGGKKFANRKSNSNQTVNLSQKFCCNYSIDLDLNNLLASVNVAQA